VADEGNPESARVELARLYLEAFGPATLDDFAWWSGFTKTSVKQIFGALLGELPPDRELVDAPEPPPARAAKGDPVRLLPPWDTYLVAYKDRSRYAAEQQLPWLYDKRGNAAPVVMHAGRAAGLWQFDGDDVRVAWLPGAQAPSKKGLTDEAARTAKLLGFGAKPKVVEVDCPKPLAEQKVNAHLSPLG